jgi:Ca2+-transporting ATPase
MATTGLTSERATRVLREHGRNELPQPPSPTLTARIAGQLRDPMILLLLGACLVTIWLGDTVDTAVIAGVVVVNTALGVAQELRAERALATLGRLAAPSSKVRRDGVLVVVPAADLVPGDVVQLEAGDIVPADAEVAESHALQVDEAAMTGESVPVERDVGNEVWAGTVVMTGRALAVVTRTGAESALGRIAELVASARTRPTPLQRRLGRLSRLLVAAAGAASAVVFALGVAQGRDAARMLVTAVSLAVAAVPESLPAVVSVALALGAYRMARRSAIVRSLPAVETLGSITVLASDKTGTLTEGRMVARDVWTLETGRSHDAMPPSRPVIRLLEAAALCNDARVPDGSSDATPFGDPLETALLTLAVRSDVSPTAVRATWPRVAESPFDSVTRTMTTTHRRNLVGGGERTVVKGAPEAVLARVDGYAGDAARTVVDEMATDGMRVIAIAEMRSCGGAPVGPGPWELVGLIGVADPPRESARDVVDACVAAGVGVVMVTGDHPVTARAIASEVGILDRAPRVVEASELHRGREDVSTADIGAFARTRPEQKVEIVKALQAAGGVVAVTGDGVNDAPALRAADIGVAMGHGGTEVARQAADLVLADDNLETVVAAIEEGRRILSNIRRFLRYALSGGLAEILVLLAAPFLGMPTPLLPAQILWINLLTHGVPGVAFGAEPGDPSAMRRPASPPDRSVLGDGLGAQIALGGAMIAAATLTGGLVADARGWPVQSTVFVVLGMAQLATALALRAPRRRRRLSDRALEVAVAVSALLQVAAVYTPPLQSLLHTSALDAGTVAVAGPLALLPALAIAVLRRLASAHRRFAPFGDVYSPSRE